MKKIFITIITMLLSMMARSATNINGILYVLDSSNKTAKVTCDWGLQDYSKGTYSGRISIPSQVTYNGVTYDVTAIGNSAFEYCDKLTSVTIPSSVTSIGVYAFSRCEKLTSIIIPNGVTTIGEETFSRCNNLSSISIPNSVTSIGNSAFGGCSLTSINIPNSVISIGPSAFAWCVNLSSIIIPYSVNSIGSSAFLHTAWYDNQPDGLVYAGKVAYKYKGTMPDNSSITIKDGTQGIAGSAFSDCTGLVSITIPNSVTSIGDSPFSGCSGLTSITVKNGNTIFDSRNNCNAIIETESNTLIVGCKNTTIPNSVISIGGSAFYKCSSLTSLMIPNSVTSIGNYAFEGCNNLQYVCVISDIFPSTYYPGNASCQYIMPQSAYDGGISKNITNYATYGVSPKYIKVKSKTATSATLELIPIDITSGKAKGTTTYEVKICDLKPGASISGSWKLGTMDQGVVKFSDVKTNDLEMNVQAAQALSTTKARLSATVSEANDDKRYGFEWLRYDAPDNMTPNRVSAPLYNGQIVGTLSNLNPDIYYKYRPFYKADDGTIYRGDWEAFITGDANVFFEPEVHTNEPVALTEDGAQLSGVWVEGTEDIQEKGFEYWPKNSGARPTRAGNVTAIIVKGNNTSITLEGLEAGTEYVYRSYLRTASGTVYGEEKTFKTPLLGDANNDGKVNVADVVEVVNAKAGNPSSSFNMTNADTDGSGTLTEADITAIANIIMQK